MREIILTIIAFKTFNAVLTAFGLPFIKGETFVIILITRGAFLRSRFSCDCFFLRSNFLFSWFFRRSFWLSGRLYASVKPSCNALSFRA